MSLLRTLSVSLCALVVAVAAPAFAADPFDPADEEDRVAVEALALYPEDVRNHILEASTETDRVHDLDRLQQRSQADFRELLEPYSENDQQDLFDLSRYPDLVEAIAEGGPKGRSELERIASRYPSDVREAVLRQGGARHRTIVRMNELLDDFDRRFDDLVADLPPRKAEAFRALLGSPEVLSLMTEHDDLTVALGDAYERDPQGTRERFADLGLAVARRNAEEADDWKEAVDRDPDLRRDYEAASRDYQADTGYAAYGAPRSTVNVVVNPYPYWVGYPWWYPVTYTYYDPWYWWYPRPYWGHVGWHWGPRFYTGFGGPIWRPWYPTPYFTSWYFSFGHHHARYPYLTDRYVGFYGYHDHWDDDWDGRRVVNNVKVVNHYNFNKRVVKKFVYETDRVVSRDFLRGSREERVKRIREFGKVAPELEKVQREARRKELGRDGRRADRMRVPDRVADADRATTRRAANEIVRKREKEAPDLARFAGERPAAAEADGRRGRGRDAAAETGEKGRRDGTGDVQRDRRGRDAAGVEPGEGGRRDGERGQARERGGRDAPAALGPDAGEKAERGGARERGRSGAERGDADGRGRDGKARAGERDGRDVPTLAPNEPGERGSARQRDATPDAGRGAGRDRDADRVRERDADRGGKAARPTEPSGRATPTFERPGGERGGRGDGGGGGARQGGGRKGGSDSDADRGDGGRKDGDRGDDAGVEPSARSRSGGADRSAARRDSPRSETRAARPQVERESRREQPRVEREREQPRMQQREVRREAPRPQSVERERPRSGGGGGGYESQRSQPRVERPSGGSRERQGGGNGGGGGKRNKSADEEEQQGG
ncbi:MAG TPA: hypothetical protein VHQ66_03745, partial [Myxococcota bacterium]|nr:hypothetical protein [Myxococcota bacterium]